jgi:tRNA pseudouridine13 synthase
LKGVQPPAPDADCGMLVYSTSGPRLEGRLRANFGDFRVRELISLELSKERSPGLVPVYEVEKTGIDTPHVAREIAAAIRSEVNFAGLKDKNASVVQYVSARSTRASAPPEIEGDRFHARLVGFSRPVNRGMLTGNRFRIVLESVDEVAERIAEVLEAARERRIANFFGYQRFGLKGGTNRLVGRAIVRRDFGEAVDLLLTHPRKGEEGDAVEARRLAGEMRYHDAADLFSSRQDLERRMAVHLASKPDDFLGALRRIPIPIRRLLVNSYQSYLFNLTLSRIVAEQTDFGAVRQGDNWASLREGGLSTGRVRGVREVAPEGSKAVPLVQIVGYAHRDYGSRFDALLEQVLRDERVAPSSFYVKEAEEMSSEGGFRAAPLLAVDLGFEKAERGYAVEFSLGKGEYATVVMRELLKPEDPLAAGF